MSSDAEYPLICLWTLYVFLGEVSVQVLCPFFNWVVCLAGVESCEFFIWNFLRKLKIELPFDPLIPLLRLYPKNPDTPIQKDLAPQCSDTQFTIAKYWKQPKCPSVNEWIKNL